MRDISDRINDQDFYDEMIVNSVAALIEHETDADADEAKKRAEEVFAHMKEEKRSSFGK